jgi:hypothetical protein
MTKRLLVIPIPAPAIPGRQTGDQRGRKRFADTRSFSPPPYSP